MSETPAAPGICACVRQLSCQLDAALAELQGEVALTETEKERLFVRAGVDVTDPATLSPDLFAGVQQVGGGLDF